MANRRIFSTSFYSCAVDDDDGNTENIHMSEIYFSSLKTFYEQAMYRFAT